MTRKISTRKQTQKARKQNKNKTSNCENKRPNNCITEKYLQNDKHIVTVTGLEPTAT